VLTEIKQSLENIAEAIKAAKDRRKHEWKQKNFKDTKVIVLSRDTL